MRAAVMRGGEIVVDTIPDPVPSDGQVLVKTLACGICGSDLHALHHAEEMTRLAQAAGSPAFAMDLERDVVMGHEFCAEIVEFGPGTTQTLKKGDRVVTNGGLHGEVTGIEGSVVFLKIADQVKVRVSRSSVAQIEDEGGSK